MSTPAVPLLPTASPGERTVHLQWATPAPDPNVPYSPVGYYVWFNVYNTVGPTVLSQGYRMPGATLTDGIVPLPDSQQYIFGVTAYDNLGRESPPSNLVGDPPLPPPVSQAKSTKPKVKKNFFNQKKKGGESP
jgi:hypothetical protein